MSETAEGISFHQDAHPIQGKKTSKKFKPGKDAPIYCAFPKVTFGEALVEEYQPY
jgi:hypothetical protein